MCDLFNQATQVMESSERKACSVEILIRQKRINHHKANITQTEK